jgi:zinc protease
MRKVLSAVVATCLLSPFIQAQTKMIEKVTKKGDEIIIPYEKYQLPNGLTVVLHEDHSDPIVHVDVTYHVGSAREEIGKSGFAHFFEHMQFQGSDHVGDEQHFKIITAAGGTLNGSTNQDRTNYYETVPSNQLEKMIWLEADRMGFFLDAVTQKKFEVQRSTVKNERGQNYDNRPYGLVNEFSSKNLYPYGHPYSWLTIGYVEDLNRVDVNDLKNFFLRWYGPNNATITIGGDIKPTETLKWIEKYFGSIPRGPEVSKTILPAVSMEKDRYVSYVDNYARVPLLMKTFPTVPNYHPDMAALSCLAQILGQGKTSVLYQDLVKTQKALQASASSRLSELAGEFSVQMVPLPGKSLAAMDSLFKESLLNFEKRGVTDEDIEKFKGGIESQYIGGLQSVSGKVSQLAAFQTFAGNPNMIGPMINMYLSVNKADVLRVYNEYIKNKPSVTVSVLTKSDKNGPAVADNFVIDSTRYDRPNYGYDGLTYSKGKDNFDRSVMPAPGKNPVVTVPKYWKKKLPNGINAIGADYNELPLVNISITIPGGHLAQSTDTAKIGLAGMVGSMLNEDTKNYTAEKMSVELQKLGSSVSVSSTFDGMRFSMQTLKKNLDKTIALLEERMLRPKFSQDAFNRLQKQAMESFKQAKSQPSTIASNVYDKISFGAENILGMSDNGTEYTTKNLTLEDVQKYYDNYMTSQKAKLVIVGNVTEAEIMPKLQFLNKLPNKNIALPKPPAEATKGTTTIYLVNVPKAAQTEFRVGKVLDMSYNPTGEFYQCDLMNYVLGANFNSRLNLNLREDKGWTYGARANFSGNKYFVQYTFSSGIRADATDSALTEVLKEINTYAASGITAEELEFMKSALGQRDALLYETPSQKSGFVSRLLEYNLEGNYVDVQNKMLNDFTKMQSDALAKKWLQTQNLNILLVGDKAKIMDGLTKFGYPIVELDVDGNKK